MMQFLELVFLDPMVNALLFLYGLLGDYVVALVLLTIIVRLLTYPLTRQQQRSTRRMQELQPELEKIKKKYEKDREQLAAKQMELYKKHGVNPTGGCLPTLIQFPILIGFYRAITQTLAASPLQLLNLSQHVYRTLPNLNDLIPLDSRFLWLDLAAPDPFFVLPVLVVATTFAQQKLLTPPSADPQQAGMAQSMQITMPIMIGFFALTFPSGLSIYWITSSVVGIAQYVAEGRATFINKLLGREEEDAGGKTKKLDKGSKSKPADKSRRLTRGSRSKK
jgi:YidC/Oxa1 family membrane protein insertase